MDVDLSEFALDVELVDLGTEAIGSSSEECTSDGCTGSTEKSGC
ncbi:hypothetical protein [Mangrovactinospora gilvigrisea]|nr:hypothetical protein [Mangrovactinospora gilvigrisea]